MPASRDSFYQEIQNGEGTFVNLMLSGNYENCARLENNLIDVLCLCREDLDLACVIIANCICETFDFGLKKAIKVLCHISIDSCD